MIQEHFISKCCEAEVKIVGGDEGTYHWECLNCGEACDTKNSAKRKKMVWLKNLFLRLIWPLFDKGGVRACTWEAFKHKLKKEKYA